MGDWHRWRPASLNSLTTLRPADIPREIGAGISVAAVAVPIGLAYAKLTGVRPKSASMPALCPP